ncbi:FtsW/RodA/SpoVE family cell cycle protein [Latilactobacillus fuchuensis]|uniref:Cell cycle family protein n=1 Tax=Latilactobacillus fuchuensis DSM 14340 = JCM 11249 TaxID=1423747 RepID=A0A0R1RQW3_9LACO|nr:FtsW/RodA/SpoVE family cell cycle protein [Latilactobacillus fuchuensis]KRL59382.1 cell cycle family protein [Latilactobacillus fuchuensis DSM 14340 = JCM 11249]
MPKELETTEETSRIDYGIVFSVFMLALVGLMSIYVAVLHDTSGSDPVRAVIMQAVWYVIGGIAIVIIMQFDSEQLWRIAPLVYGVGIFLLIAVLFLYNRQVATQTGAKSWFALGPISFQPSEVMKPAYILMLGRVVTQHNTEYSEHTMRSDWLLLVRLLLWTLPVMVLLKLQNDFGTMLVFFAILGGVVLVSGVTWKILAPTIAVAGAIGGTALSLAATTWGRAILTHVGFKTYQFNRIDAWLHPFDNTASTSLQLSQSLKAIGSGQLFGKGFNNIQVNVPVRESDMIFSVIGENFGFIGSCFVILLYFLLIYQMIRITFDTKNEFYAYVSTGVIMMILFHVFENIGMSVGLLPLTGIPLPFISQGGSSLLGNMIGIGFMMSMRYHYKSYMFSESEDTF